MYKKLGLPNLTLSKKYHDFYAQASLNESVFRDFLRNSTNISISQARKWCADGLSFETLSLLAKAC